LPSAEPEAAAAFIQALIENAHEKSIAAFSNDVSRVKNTRVSNVKEKLNALSVAARQSREARIKRIEERNRQAIATLQLQIDLKLSKARQDREDRIVRVQEALKTARQLDLTGPVHWDDLRPLRESSQVINEVRNGEEELPDYFRGTRLLEAELARLQEREIDKPFIDGLTELENQIAEIRSDPELAALKARADDMIYVEEYDDLQRQLSDLLKQPTEFSNARMAVVTQPAQVPANPTRSPLVIFVLGLFLSAIFALFVAMISMALRSSESRQADGAIAES